MSDRDVIAETISAHTPMGECWTELQAVLAGLGRGDRDGGRSEVKKIGVRDAPARQREMLLYLELAVPLEMQRLAMLSTEELQTLALTANPQISQHGDDLEFGGLHAARTASVLARAIACAALITPGGVTAFGGHWCTNHRECEESS